MSELNSLKLAVLIDADNAQASVCENLLKEIDLDKMKIIIENVLILNFQTQSPL